MEDQDHQEQSDYEDSQPHVAADTSSSNYLLIESVQGAVGAHI